LPKLKTPIDYFFSRLQFLSVSPIILRLMENKLNPAALSPIEQQRRQEELEFCRALCDVLKNLQALRDNPDDDEARRLAESTAPLIAESIYHYPTHFVRVSIPPQVKAHTSREHVIDPDKPTEFIAAAIRRLTPEQVEFTSGPEINSQWLVVYDNFDKLRVEPYFPEESLTGLNLG
jgi:hypothetical protein